MAPDKRRCALYRWPSGKRQERTSGVGSGDGGGGGGSMLPAVVCHTEPGDLLVLSSNVSRTARPPLPRAFLLLFLLLSA